jgi:arylsulfatase A-like enzyme
MSGEMNQVSFHKPTVLSWCLVLASCASRLAGAAGAEPARPSVIFISLDTLRADRLSSYGYSKIRTPHIDSFAQGGTLFAQAEAQVPLTLPSHTSLFTSTYPFENRVEENGERVPAGVVTLAAVLRSAGYQTAAFIGSDFLDRHYGLDQGFEDYDSPFAPRGGEALNPRAASVRRDGALVLRAARQWLEQHAHSGRPAFVFVHLFDLHVPYSLAAEVARKQGISRYDAQLEYVDGLMDRFQQELKDGGWWDRSVVVLFGDHGEGLGDHQEMDHGYYVYESTLHVPLIIHWPLATRNSKFEIRNSPPPATSRSGNDYAERVDFPVGLIDVAPTILDYLRVPVPDSFEGASLLGALKTGESASARAVYSESIYAHDAFRCAPLHALRVGKYKYIQAPRAELYDLERDPGERTNLLRQNTAMAAELLNQLAKVLARYAPPQRAPGPALSPETLAELESLGYLAVSGRAGAAGDRPGAPQPDPKDRFAEFTLYENAFVAFLEGHTAAALPQFQSILKLDPQNTLARFHLGECYLRAQRPQEALREWTTALQFDPGYAPAAEAIGQYWLKQGDYQKARRRFQQVVALAPDSYSGHFQLALADEHLGLLPEAREHLAAACRIAPQDEECARELARVGGK